MTKGRLLLLTFFVLINVTLWSQNGPGGVGAKNGTSELTFWLIADSVSGSDGSDITIWPDISGRANDFSQAVTTFTPILRENAVNGRNLAEMSKSNNRIVRTGFGDMPTNAITSVTVFRSTDDDAGVLSYAISGGQNNEYLLFDPPTLRVYVDNAENATGVDVTSSAFQIMMHRWQSSDGSNQVFIDNSSVVSNIHQNGATMTTGGAFAIGGEQDGLNSGYDESQNFDGDIAEIILFNTYINDAEVLAVNNYLSTRYNITLGANDRYAYEATNSIQLAGIAQVGTDVLDSANSSDLLNISGATGMITGESMFLAHDGSGTTWTATETAQSGQNIRRIAREWRLDETGEVGTVTFKIDTSSLSARPSLDYNRFVLLVDDDGDFTNATAYEMTSVGGDEFYQVDLDLADGQYLSIGTVIPSFYFATANQSDFETNDPFIDLFLNYVSLSPVQVTYGTADTAPVGATGAASLPFGGGDDYLSISSTVANFPAGVQTVQFSLDVNQDIDLEGAGDSLRVILSSPTAGHQTFNTPLVFTINDDDNARKVYYDVSTSSINEFQSAINVQVNLTPAQVDFTNPTTVNYSVNLSSTATGDGTDFTLANGTLTIPIGNVSNTLTVAINDDVLNELNETVIIDLSSPTNADLSSVEPIQHTLTILDDEIEPTVQFNTISSSGDESTSPSISITSSAIAAVDVTVDYVVTGTATSGNVDYTFGTAGTAIISGGSLFTTLLPTIIDDSEFESAETLIITLSNPQNATLGADTVFTYSITDNESAFGFSGPGGVGATDGASPVQFWLVADSISGTAGNTFSSWNDESGYGNTLGSSAAGGTVDPTYQTALPAINDHDYVDFSAAEAVLITPGSNFNGLTGAQFTVYSVLRDPENGADHIAPVQYELNGDDNEFLIFHRTTFGAQLFVDADADDDAGRSDASIDDGNWRIFSSRWRSADGRIQYYSSGDSLRTANLLGGGVVNGGGTLSVGHEQDGEDIYGQAEQDFDGDLAELIIFNSYLNEARRIIVDNYFSTKYGLALSADDYYTGALELAGYDVELAGIGRALAAEVHDDAQSGGILRINNASDLDESEYLLFAHNNGASTFSTSERPLGADSIQRIAREWAIDETAADGIGTVDIMLSNPSVSLGALPANHNGYVLLIDDDGDFSNGGTTVTPMTLSGSDYVVTGVDINDSYITFGTVGIIANFTASSSTVSEGGTSINVEVTLNNSPSSGSVDVSFATEVSSTATEGGGADFTYNLPSPLTFGVGVQTQNIIININDDATTEIDEAVVIELTGITGGTLGSDTLHTTTIFDNDALSGGSTGPGGVRQAGAYEFWLHADSAVFSDAGTTPSVDGGIVTQWNDLSSGAQNHNASVYVTSSEPLYNLTTGLINGMAAIDFSGADQGLTVVNQTGLNDITSTAKTTIVAFETGADVTTQQMVYEQGGGSNGLNVFIESNLVHVGIWDNDWSDVTAGYYEFTLAATANTKYIVSLEFRGASQRILGTINGVVQTPFTIIDANGNNLDAHIGLVGIGGLINATRVSGSSAPSDDGALFSGKVMQIIQLNDSINDAERIIIENYLGAKYDISLTGANDRYAYDATHPNGVVGIGQTGGEFHLGSTSDSTISISNPSAIADDDYLILGHDNLDNTSFSGVEVPDSTIERLTREYRVSKTNDLGSILLSIDTTRLPAPSVGFTNYAILVDADGDFSDGAQVYSMTRGSNEFWETTIDFLNGDYFTIAVIEPVVSFTVALDNQSEATSPALLEVSLNYPIVENVTVDFDTTALTTAISGVDITYPSLPSSVVIAAGDSATNISLTILNDGLIEAVDDTVVIRLTDATNALVSVQDSMVFLINDDDNTQEIDFTVSTTAVTEASGVANLILRLNAVNGADSTTVKYAVNVASTATEGVDYTLASGTAQIDAGALTTVIQIPIIDDFSDENDETIIVNLSAPVNAALGLNTTHTVSVGDNDDVPELNFSNVQLSGSENISTANFDVAVSVTSGKVITFDYEVILANSTASLGSDYTLSNGSLVIPAGTASLSITASILDDIMTEVDENFEIRIFNNGNLNNATIGALDTAAYTINDNDAGGFRGPGGVNEPDFYTFWLRSDRLVQRDSIAGTLASNGNIVQRWLDFSTNGNNAKGITGDEPLYLVNAVNGKPSINFNAVDSALVIDNVPEINDGNGPFNERTIVAAFQAGSDVTTQQVVYEEGGGTNGLAIYVENDSVFVAAWAESATVPWAFDTVGTAITSGQTMIAMLEFSVSDGGRLTGYFNADSVGSKTGKNEGVPNHTGGISIGGSDDGWEFGSGDMFTGEVMETILINGRFIASQRIVVENYLGAKYGVNLAGSGNDFFAYDVSHGFDPIGIGRDSDTDFHTKSQSDSLLTIGSAADLGNGEYLFTGHDNGSIASYVTTDVPGTNLERLQREWRVAETGDLGTITLSIDTIRLGLTPSSGFTEYVLMVDTDGLFSSDATLLPMTKNGSEYEIDIDFTSGDYFTFAVVQPEIQFVTATSNGSETIVGPTVNISLNYPLSRDISVIITETGNGTATEDVDFTFNDSTQTISAGATSIDAVINITDDAAVENDETIEIQLSSPSVGILGTNTTHLYTINDDDNFRKANFQRSDSTNTEDQAPIQIGVFLNARNTGSTTSIFYSVTGGTALNDSTDFFVQAVDTLVFAINDTLEFIDINVIDDLIDEDTETLIISLTGGTGATIGDTTVFTYTIQDNDLPPSVQFSTATRSGVESAQTIDLAVELSGVSGKDIIVPFTSTALTATLTDDYQLTSSSITILAGNTTDSIQFLVINDGLTEANEQLRIDLGVPTNASLGANANLTYTILDDDGLGFRGPGGVGNLDEQIAAWFRSTDPGFGLSNGDLVANILDRTNNSNDGFQSDPGQQPQYLENIWNNRPSLTFDGSDLIQLNNTDDINTGGPYDQKTIMVSFRTSADVTTRQMIYEEGGGVRGLSIYIDNGSLYIGGWNNNDDDAGATTPWPSPGPPTNNTIFTTRTVAANSNNFVFLQFDFLAGTGVIDGDVSASINGENLITVDGAGRLFAHPGNIGIGGVNNGTVVHDGNEGIVQNYNGNLGEAVIQNFVYNPAQFIIVNNYLSSKYNILLTSVQDVFAYDVTHSYELLGIGQVSDSSHTDSQGQGIVRISNPSGLDNSEFLMVGHDNGEITSWTSSGVPNGDTDNFRLLGRNWRMDETGDVGSITLRLDASSLPSAPVGFLTNYVLIIDDDGDFSTDATVYQLASDAGYFSVSNLDIPTDAFFTFGLANPVIGFISDFVDGAEDVSPANVEVGLNYITQTLVTVDVDSTINSSAQPVDFTLASNTVSINAGSQTGNVVINLTNDSEDESSETIQLALSNPSTGVLSSADTAVFSILDDDIERFISFILTDSTGAEGDPNVFIRVFADSLSNADSLSVYYEVIGGTAVPGQDFTWSADSLKWPLFSDNPNDTVRTIPITITQDLLDEPLETIEIRLSSPIQASLGTNRTFIYNITDDDNPPTIDWSVASGSGPETTTSVNAILSLSAPSGQDITLNYSDQSTNPPTPGGIDYDLQGTSIVIPAGQSGDTIQFSVFDDAIAGEGSENVVIQIDGATGATASIGSQFTYTILDDDGGFGPLGPGGIGNDNEMAFWLRADSGSYSDLGATLATNGVDVRQWNDQGGNSNTAIDATVSVAVDSVPTFVATVAAANNRPAFDFVAANFELLTIPDNSLINNNTEYTLKSIGLVFQTGATDPPVDNEVIYEQGGGGNGLNIYHGTDGDLHFGAWSSGSSPSWPYNEVTATVGPNELVMAIFEIDASTGDLNVYINGAAVANTNTGVNSVLNGHGGDIGIGAVKNQTLFASGTQSAETSNFFDGQLFEIVQYNERNLNVPARRILRNHWAAKYGVNIAGEDIYAYESTHFNEVFGIGAANSEIHIASKGSGIITLDNPQSINDGDYLLIGHDGAAIDAFSTTNTPPAFGNTFLERVARTWRVDETGDFGSVRVSIDTTQLPTLSSGFEDLFILVSSSATFATFDTLIRFSETFGNDLRASFDFTAGQYFTLATAQNVTIQDGAWNDPATWVIGVPAVNETAFVADSIWLTTSVTASTVVGLDGVGGRGKINLQSFTLNVQDSLLMQGFGPPNRDSTSFTPGTGTVNYGGAGTEIFIQPLVYYNLTVSGTGRRHLRSETLIMNDFTIDDNPELLTNGNDMEIRGDWSSAISATFTPGAGTVRFNGTGPQRIDPTNSRITFNNLIVDNPGGDIILGDSVEITSVLTLTQNDIVLGDEMLIISSTAPGAIVAPGDNTSYIQADGNGALKRSIAQGNTYTYPIGDASGNYTPLTFTPSALVGSSPQVEVNLTDARNASIEPSRTHISRYWTIEPTGVSSATYDITMAYNEADVSGDEAELVPIKFSTDADTSDFPSFTLNTTANTLLWQGLTSFSITTGGTLTDALLPVELLSFIATPVDQRVQLKWATATEKNNDRFEVQWSADGFGFETIGELNGAGNTSDIQEYAFKDNNPLDGINYYRLKQIDFDGKTDFSHIIFAEIAKEQEKVSMVLFPNPATQNNINIRVSGLKEREQITLKLVDLFGKTYHSEIISNEQQEYKINPREQLTRGMYYLTYSIDGKQEFIKLLLRE